MKTMKCAWVDQKNISNILKRKDIASCAAWCIWWSLQDSLSAPLISLDTLMYEKNGEKLPFRRDFQVAYIVDAHFWKRDFEDIATWPSCWDCQGRRSWSPCGWGLKKKSRIKNCAEVLKFRNHVLWQIKWCLVPFRRATLTLPLPNSELQALEGVVIRLWIGLIFGLMKFSQERVWQSLFSCEPGLWVQQ